MASKNSSSNLPANTASAGLPATSKANVPAFMQGAEKGMGDVDAEDLIIPRVALMQGISPPVMAGQVEQAHFWHTIMEEDLGTSLRIVPILRRKQYTLWMPLHSGGGIIARASDGRHWDSDFDVQVAPYKDFPKRMVRYTAKAGDLVGREHGLGKWGSADPENPDSGPAATVSHVFLVRAIDHMDLGPFIVYLQRSSEGVARDLMTKIKFLEDGSNVPMYGQVYNMTSETAQNDAGQEYNKYKFARLPGDEQYVQDEALFKLLMSEHHSYKGLKFRTNDEDAQDDSGGAGAGGGSPDSKDDAY